MSRRIADLIAALAGLTTILFVAFFVLPLFKTAPPTEPVGTMADAPMAIAPTPAADEVVTTSYSGHQTTAEQRDRLCQTMAWMPPAAADDSYARSAKAINNAEILQLNCDGAGQ